MIYDKSLTVYKLDASSSPLARRLRDGVSYFYAEQEVYSSRYNQARQAGERITMLVEILLSADDTRIPAEDYCIPADGSVYRIVQAQYGYNDDGLAVTRLSLQLMEGKYGILRS